MKAKIHGVCRQGGRGIPENIKQDKLTKQDEEYRARGTLKVAVCKGDEEMIDIICTSLYDVKPFYMMSTVCAKIEWVKKWMEVYCAIQRKKVKVHFYRLNLADTYNFKMGRVDIGDQLQHYYRFDHFMRKRKWWWSFWMWSMGMLLTNTYIVYKRFHEVHKSKQVYSHYEFVCSVARAWLQPERHNFRSGRSYSNLSNDDNTSATTSTYISMDRRVEIETTTSARRTSARRSVLEITDETTTEKKRKTTMSDATLKSQFRERLNDSIPHWPVKAATNKQPPRCQLHTWATQSKVRKKADVVRCETCDVYLCIDCFKLFHKTRDIVKEKSKLRQKFLNDQSAGSNK